MDRMNRNEGDLPVEVQSVFAAYRAALPDFEPGANFSPAMWAKIDAKRRVSSTFKRLTGAFVTAAAAICLLLTAGSFTMQNVQTPTSSSTSYVDALIEEAAQSDAEAPVDRYEEI